MPGNPAPADLLALESQPSAGAPSQQAAAAAIAQAASRYQVPVQLLAGIYGRESSFGTAYSAGQSTYGYFGLTSPGLWSPGFSIEQDADTAARTLRALYDSTHSWNAATLAYSGNAYGQAQAQSTAATNKSLLDAIGVAAVSLPTGTPVPPGITGPGGIAGTLDSAAVDTGKAVSSVPDALNNIGAIFSGAWSAVTNPHNWLRALEILGAVVAIYMALRSLTGAKTLGQRLEAVRP